MYSIWVYLLAFFLSRILLRDRAINPVGSDRRKVLKQSIMLVVPLFLLPGLADVLLMALALILAWLILDLFWKPYRLGSYNLALILFILFWPFLFSKLSQFLLFYENPLFTVWQWLCIQFFNFGWHPEDAMLNRSLGLTVAYLFTIQEGTWLIRLTIQRIQAQPKQAGSSGRTDQREYDRGRLIGILERTLVYLFVISGQYGAIAIVIGLKSLARFRELEDRSFAEYFLIGSLLSMAVAILPALLILRLYPF
jgi:hypothetical protein